MDIAETSPNAAIRQTESRLDRDAREAEMSEAALASVAAGRTVSEEQFDAWVDSLGSYHELPPPRSGR